MVAASHKYLLGVSHTAGLLQALPTVLTHISDLEDLVSEKKLLSVLTLCMLG